MDLAVQVGARLKALRLERGLSLSELARRSGTGKGTLSELESGRRNPTLETLYALTTALGTPLSAALADEPISGAAVDAVLTERFDDGTATTEVYRVRIRAGAVQRSAPHAPGTRERLVVLTGTARVGDGLLVGPGEQGTWAADVPHSYAAAHERDVEAVLFVRYPR